MNAAGKDRDFVVGTRRFRALIQRSMSLETTAQVRIGISGWRYAPWRGVFYPPGLAQRKELAFAAERFRSIEINGSFYSLQRPESYRRWSSEVPHEFVFAVKGGRYITHFCKLRDVEIPLANFFASGLLALGDKLGPILWQFPENFGAAEARFEQFFKLLPRDTIAAADMARGHDARLADRSHTDGAPRRPLRHAVEVRSPTTATPAFVELLRRHGIALVVADTAGRWPYFEDVTADFMYVRLHGDKQLYQSGYGPAAIDRWARRIATWSAGKEPPDGPRLHADRAPERDGRDVYVYFDNDMKVHAPFDAFALSRALKLKESTARPIRHRAAVSMRADPKS